MSQPGVLQHSIFCCNAILTAFVDPLDEQANHIDIWQGLATLQLKMEGTIKHNHGQLASSLFVVCA